jgi:hypothetical protein
MREREGPLADDMDEGLSEDDTRASQVAEFKVGGRIFSYLFEEAGTEAEESVLDLWPNDS